MTASLNRRERRTLRDIEVHLAAEDPVLAGMLGCVRTARLQRRIRGVTRWIGGAAVAQLVLGLLLATLGPGGRRAADSGTPARPVAVVGDAGSLAAVRDGVG